VQRRCRGGAEEAQRRCRGAGAEVLGAEVLGAEEVLQVLQVQRWRYAEMQWCRGSEMQRCMQRCRYHIELQRCSR